MLPDEVSIFREFMAQQNEVLSTLHGVVYKVEALTDKYKEAEEEQRERSKICNERVDERIDKKINAVERKYLYMAFVLILSVLGFAGKEIYSMIKG